MINCPLFRKSDGSCMVDKSDAVYCPYELTGCCLMCQYKDQCPNHCKPPENY